MDSDHLIKQFGISNDIFFQSNIQVNRLVTRNYLLVITYLSFTDIILSTTKVLTPLQGKVPKYSL